MRELIQKIDVASINLFRKWEVTLARIAIFTVYFWFGLLKLIGMSPAAPLVQGLFERTINFMPFGTFYLLFSIFEVVIGILFLMRGMERLAISLLGIHMITTIMPLFLMPDFTWQAFLIPTLEGQYIIKNILIIACAFVVGSRITPKSPESNTI